MEKTLLQAICGRCQASEHWSHIRDHTLLYPGDTDARLIFCQYILPAYTHPCSVSKLRAHSPHTRLNTHADSQGMLTDVT